MKNVLTIQSSKQSDRFTLTNLNKLSVRKAANPAVGSLWTIERTRGDDSSAIQDLREMTRISRIPVSQWERVRSELCYSTGNGLCSCRPVARPRAHTGFIAGFLAVLASLFVALLLGVVTSERPAPASNSTLTDLAARLNDIEHRLGGGRTAQRGSEVATAPAQAASQGLSRQQ